MKIRIRSVKTSELITPGTTIQWLSEANGFILLEALSPAFVEWRTYRALVHPGQIVLGKKFRITNPNITEFVNVRGVVFQSEDNPRDPSQPVIIYEHNDEMTKLLTLIYQLFQSETSKTALLDEIELHVNSFFDSVPVRSGKDTDLTRNPVGKIDPRLIMINRYIRKNYHQPLTLLDLAELIKCNPTYLSNTYSKVFKISPIKHIQNLRMEKAKGLLQRSGICIGEIARKLGYISSSQFSDLFKKHHGLTPSEFRRERIFE